MKKRPEDNFKKVFNLQWLSSLPKRLKRWDLLFIDEHGKVVSFQYVRGLLISLAAVIVILLAGSFYLCYLQKSANEKKADLENALEASRKELKEVQEEMNTLMIRLAEAQSKIPKQAVLKNPESKKETSNNVSLSSGKVRSEVKADKPKNIPSETSGGVSKTSSSRTRSDTPSEAPPEILKPADVYDFSAFHDPELSALNVRFLIKNPNENSTPLVGYLFVIMKENDTDKKEWVPIPRVKLVSGKPSRFKEGQFFKIRNFKTVEMWSGEVTGPKAFSKATVFEFSPTGQLLLEKTFPVKINVAEIPAENTAPEAVTPKPVKIPPEPEGSQMSNSLEEPPDMEGGTEEIILRETREKTTGSDDVPAITE